MFKVHKVDYVSNTIIRSYPDGMDTQVFMLKTLKYSAEISKNKLDREHVTLHIRNNPQLFNQLHLVAPPEIHWPELGLTLDELSDYKLIKKIIDHFYNEGNLFFSCNDVVRFLRKNPSLLKINQFVLRKGNN